MAHAAVRQKKSTAWSLTKSIYKYLLAASTACGLLLFCTSATPAKAYASPARTVKRVTVLQQQPFETTYLDDPDKYKGYSEVVSEGVVGKTEVNAQLLYENGEAVQILSIQSVQIARLCRRGGNAGGADCGCWFYRKFYRKPFAF